MLRGFSVLLGTLCVLAMGSALAQPMQPGQSPSAKPSGTMVAKAHSGNHGPRFARNPATGSSPLKLHSASALVIDQDADTELVAKNSGEVVPIASITKLMTAMVVLDTGLPMDELLTIESADVDTLRNSSSRLRVGTVLPRRELLRLALMASENRAAAALARTHPGGSPAFVAAMNVKAAQLGMEHSRFVDSTGLNSDNVSTARDLARMVRASYGYELIRDFSTASRHEVELPVTGRTMEFRNSNRLVSSQEWDIGVSKTGFIREAGRCLVMQANISGRRVIIVLLDSWGKLTRVGDANRIRRWMETRVIPGSISG